MTSVRINLFVLIRDYPVGLAVTKKIHNLIHYLHQHNVEINVLSYRSKFKQPDWKIDKNDIPYVSIGNDLKLLHLHKTISYFIKGLKNISAGREKGFKNVFFCIGPLNVENILFVLWAKLLHYKILFDINEDYSLFEDDVKLISRLKIKTTNKLDILTHKWADAFTVVSSHLRNKYQKLTNKPVVLIPVTAAQNFNSEKVSNGKGLKVVYAGTFDLKDGVKMIIEGFLMFNRDYREAELILAGKSDQQRKYQNEYEECRDVVFTGYIPDEQFYELLRDADVLCMCRTNSGFSNAGFPFKLGEYLATGNPVISTKASDVCDYLSSDDVYFVDFESPEGIADTLKNIAEDTGKARRIGLNGFSKYQLHFSPESNGKILIDLLINL